MVITSITDTLVNYDDGPSIKHKLPIPAGATVSDYRRHTDGSGSVTYNDGGVRHLYINRDQVQRILTGSAMSAELKALRQEWITLLGQGELTFNALSAQSQQEFLTLIRSGPRDGPREFMREFWFVAAAPDSQAVIDANASLPPWLNIAPVQTTGGQWVLPISIAADSLYAPIYPLLRSRPIVQLDPDTDFPSEEI